MEKFNVWTLFGFILDSHPWKPETQKNHPFHLGLKRKNSKNSKIFVKHCYGLYFILLRTKNPFRSF